MRKSILNLLVAATVVSVSTPALAQAPAAGGAAREGQRRAERERPERPEFERAPDALERVSWRTRTLVGDQRLTNWRFGIGAIPNLTFFETVVRADAAGVNFVEGSSTQRVSQELQKNLGPNLTSEEVAALRDRMGSVRMQSYRAGSLGGNSAERRKLFEFVKAMGASMIVAPTVDASAAAEVDELAKEFEINVALIGRPDAVMQTLQGRSDRMSVAGETGTWLQYGRTPLEVLPIVKDRLAYVSLRDRSSLGSDARNVMLGKGAGKFTEFFNELNRLEVRPLMLTLDPSGTVDQPADIFAAVNAFESVVQPAYGKYFTDWSTTRPEPRLYLDERSCTVGDRSDRQQMPQHEMRRRMAAAVLEAPVAQPKQPRKVLVIESLQGMYHNPGIPNCNVLIDLMSRITGAFEAVFDNDLNNLKYPKIKEYDAIFINSAVGEMFADLEVRDAIERYVREGGGLGGIHGTPWASRNWDTFQEMIGAKSAPHRIENGVMKIYDPASPLMKSFGGKELPFREEYYRFEHEGINRLMWENVRVLLTVDVEVPQSSPWNGYKRPDNIYPVTWIRSFGEGRTFYCSLGHMAETFMNPQIVGHLLAGIQFLTGDIEADTTPNPPVSSTARKP